MLCLTIDPNGDLKLYTTADGTITIRNLDRHVKSRLGVDADKKVKVLRGTLVGKEPKEPSKN